MKKIDGRVQVMIGKKASLFSQEIGKELNRAYGHADSMLVIQVKDRIKIYFAVHSE